MKKDSLSQYDQQLADMLAKDLKAARERGVPPLTDPFKRREVIFDVGITRMNEPTLQQRPSNYGGFRN